MSNMTRYDEMKKNCGRSKMWSVMLSCTIGSRTNLGVPALTNLLPQTSLNVATRSPELTRLAVADSKEKKIRAFSRDPAMVELRFGQ